MAVRAKFVAFAQGCLLLGALAGAALSFEPGDWDPLWLPAVLLGLAVLSDALAIDLRGMRVSASFSVLVVAMVLLGPSSAVAISVLAVVLDAARNRSRLTSADWLENVATFATFPLVGGLLARAVGHGEHPLALAGVVVGVFLVTVSLNFVLIWCGRAVRTRQDVLSGFRTIFLPVMPAEAASALLTAAIVVLSDRTGMWAIAVLGGLLLIFQYLLRYARDARDRGDQLEQRNRELASLHVGLISTTLKTLALRDHMTARHSAAVARYARAVAEAMGLDTRSADVVHTAALFHDVGKFIFPDHVLLAHGELSESDHAMIRRHPTVGADLVSEIDGYGPVADIVRAHHERVDGLGYPDGLDGEDIPLGSRIIAVCDVYDVITARDTYRTPVTSDEAFAELQRVAGSQLDAHVVDVFIDLIRRRGMRFRHHSADDFEAELSLERRAREYASPTHGV